MDFEWKIFGKSDKVCANTQLTVMAARSIDDFTEKFKPLTMLTSPETYEIVERINGEDQHTGKQLVKMIAKNGDISMFDLELVNALERETSKLYLPYIKPKESFGISDSPLFIMENDVIYVIMPYFTDLFKEIQTLDDWI